jgi:hypothetical protein
LITLLSDTVYHSFIGEVEASNTTTIRRLTPSCRHQLLTIALMRASLISHPRGSLSAGAQQILPLLLEDISSSNCHDVR